MLKRDADRVCSTPTCKYNNIKQVGPGLYNCLGCGIGVYEIVAPSEDGPAEPKRPREQRSDQKKLHLDASILPADSQCTLVNTKNEKRGFVDEKYDGSFFSSKEQKTLPYVVKEPRSGHQFLPSKNKVQLLPETKRQPALIPGLEMRQPPRSTRTQLDGCAPRRRATYPSLNTDSNKDPFLYPMPKYELPKHWRDRGVSSSSLNQFGSIADLQKNAPRCRDARMFMHAESRPLEVKIENGLAYF